MTQTTPFPSFEDGLRQALNASFAEHGINIIIPTTSSNDDVSTTATAPDSPQFPGWPSSNELPTPPDLNTWDSAYNSPPFSMNELDTYTRSIEDYDHVVKMLDDGWGIPAPEAFQHFHSVMGNLRTLGDLINRESDTARRLFEKLGDHQIMKEFIEKRRQFPNGTINDYIAYEKSLYTPAPTQSSPSSTPRRLRCFRCNRQGHVKKTCPGPKKRRN